MERMIRVLLTKSSLDAHDRAVRTISAALRDAGVEVILTRYNVPEEVVATALQEDVDVIALSCYGLGHLHDVSVLSKLIKEKGLTHICLLMGGVIPDSDIPKLLSMGVSKIFGPGSSRLDVVAYVLGQGKSDPTVR